MVEDGRLPGAVHHPGHLRGHRGVSKERLRFQIQSRATRLRGTRVSTLSAVGQIKQWTRVSPSRAQTDCLLIRRWRDATRDFFVVWREKMGSYPRCSNARLPQTRRAQRLLRKRKPRTPCSKRSTRPRCRCVSFRDPVLRNPRVHPTTKRPLIDLFLTATAPIPPPFRISSAPACTSPSSSRARSLARKS